MFLSQSALAQHKPEVGRLFIFGLGGTSVNHWSWAFTFITKKFYNSVDWNGLGNLKKIGSFYNFSTVDFTVQRIHLITPKTGMFICTYYVYSYSHIDRQIDGDDGERERGRERGREGEGEREREMSSKARFLCLDFLFHKRKLIQRKAKEDRFFLAPSLLMRKFHKEGGCQSGRCPLCFFASLLLALLLK